jgi:hypothetical protein
MNENLKQIIDDMMDKPSERELELAELFNPETPLDIDKAKRLYYRLRPLQLAFVRDVARDGFVEPCRFGRNPMHEMLQERAADQLVRMGVFFKRGEKRYARYEFTQRIKDFNVQYPSARAFQ